MNGNTRVLFVSRAYGEHAGGMERLSWELIHSMKNLPGVDVTILAHETPKQQSLRQVRFASVFFALSVIPAVLRAARTVDVVHIGDPVLSLAGWLVRRLLGKPVAVTVHGLDVTHSNPLYQLYLKVFFRSFDAYLPISSYANEALDQFHLRGTRTVIAPGISDRTWPSRAQARAWIQELTGEDFTGRVVLGTAGRLVRRKGHAWFIEHVLPKLPSNVVYAIAGDGPERSRIEAVVENHTLQDRVHILGRVSADDLGMFYRGIDIFVQPNIPVEGDAEGFGLVLLEAALAERPVVAADIEGIRDAISGGNNGTLVPSGDAEAWAQAINSLIQQKEFDSPSARVYTLEHFSWTIVAQKYNRVLQALKPARGISQ